MASPRVFISYRRGDAAQAALDLHRAVADRIGEDRVFFDRRGIRIGDDWREVVRTQLAGADIVLALIGPRWLDELRQRSDAADDDVLRFELATALAMRKRVIPVLLDGAAIPRRRELPADLAPLADRQAAALSGSDMPAQIRRLLVQVHVPWLVAPAWALANVAAAGFGAMLAVMLLMIATGISGAPTAAAGSAALQRAAGPTSMLLVGIAGLGFGACVGFGQWLVLRSWLDGAAALIWGQAAATGLAAWGLALASRPPPDVAWGFVVGLLWYPALGLIVWAVLRRGMSRAGWFAAAHTALPVVALLSWSASISEALVGPQASLWIAAPVFAAHLVDGAMLVRLLRSAGLQRQ